MAEAAIESALDNVTQLLLYHTDLIGDARSQVEGLEHDLRLLRALLDEIGRRSKNNKASRSSSFSSGHPSQNNNAFRSSSAFSYSSSSSSSSDQVKEIRSIVYKMEDALDAYITERHCKFKKSIVIRRVLSGPAKLVVDEIRKEVQNILDRGKRQLAKSSTNVANTEIVTRTEDEMVMREDNVVGFEEEAETIIRYLREETEELDVISIVGPPGIGKSTLARKIFRDQKIENEFPTRVWVYESQVLNKKDVFLAILRELASDKDNLASKTDQELVQTLRKYLNEGKFLIVLDDVWTTEAWIDLMDAFPKLNKAGRLLITSRNVKVARCANPNRVPHQLQFISSDHSWQLLQLEVFGQSECPPDLEAYGRHIVKKCGGLPLAIVEIGRILVKKSLTEDKNATWKKVSESLHTYLKEERKVEDVVALSYNNLPYCLRACFLYFGMFPKDFEIPVWNLIRLWIAEGFIQEREGSSLEQVAQDYLEELINCSLVIMDGNVKADGQIKTCRIHEMLHNFCMEESGKENFFQEFTREAEGVMSPNKMPETCRRVCIHSKAVLNDFLSSKPIGPRVRSFVCFSEEEPFSLSHENVSSLFKLLRVFDAEPVRFTKFPKELAHLVHLRYIVMSSNFNIIPETIGELWNLQTLVFYTTSCTVEVKANIWKMMQLRHMITDAPAILPKPAGKDREAGEMLQTLGTLLPASCTEDVFGLLPNLETLLICGPFVELLDRKGFDKLGRLEKLKLVNTAPYVDSYPQVLPQLPYAHKFPPRLRWLTLCDTQLDWKHMSTLAMLDKLEVLKLKKKAFVGERWEMSDNGYFYCLEVLYIEDTNLVTWVAEKNYFPKLKRLRLRNCGELKGVPHTMRHAELDSEDVSLSYVNSARKAEEDD